MEERKPDTPPETTPNPHRGEPAPTPQEGRRPEADAEIIRPEEEEPTGPIAGLVHGAATKVKEEFTHSPEAEAEAERLGVEGEGVEAGQVLGLVAATVVAIVCLILFLYFLFYLPQLNATKSEAADVPAERYEELRENRAEAAARLSQYATSPDAEGTYRLPIEAAMALVASSDTTALPSETPVSRADFNLTGISLSPAPAVVAPEPGAETPGAETPAEAAGAGEGNIAAPDPSASGVPSDQQEEP